jgi:2-polyprenyl-3-methyl-5-hydroxy-6-metoxy-1,4-benzoquinol methylase/uncharacterized protein YbaR (Trm112 family)
VNRTLLESILCPICGRGEWTLYANEEVMVNYETGPREEVCMGEIVCPGGHHYPIRDFVLSFESLFPPDLKQEAAFWDRFYIWNIEQGAVGFHDLRRGFAPFMAQGVREAFPFADSVDRYDVHYQVAEHPLLRSGHTLLDIGVGLGWTSLHFARNGYVVTAFDPSFNPVRAAKAYAIEQGIFIEYICAAVGYIHFHTASFDNVAAFHSLHHVPDLRAGLGSVRKWLRPEGAIAVDEHIANSRLAKTLGEQLHKWAESEVWPRYRTISADELAQLPVEPHSALEDAGVDQVVPLLHEMFDVRYEHRRHVVLDHYPLLYYLWKDKDKGAFIHALEIANHLQELLRRADPDGGEYITIVAVNNPTERTSRTQAPGDGASLVTEAARVAGDKVNDAILGERAGPLFNEAGPESESVEELARLRSRVDELEGTLVEQNTWVISLEASHREKDREISRLNDHIRRLENGKVMRLLRLLRRRRNKRS